MDNHRPTWAEIDLAALAHNLALVKEAAGDAGVMAMVKANAYGHGMLEVARVCSAGGVDFFGVASLDEALDLKKAGGCVPILVMGYIPARDAEMVVAGDIRATVFTLEAAQALSRAAVRIKRPARVHLKLDTGMGRIGFLPGTESFEQIKSIAALPGLELEGIYTHFAEADVSGSSFTREQILKFTAFVDKLEAAGINIPIKHCANSAALMKFPEAHFNLIRAGIILYGLYPAPDCKQEKLGIIPVMTLKSRVSYVKTLPAGHSVSYGRTYSCRGDIRVATVPIGYADGYSRLLSNRVWAVIKGKQAPLIGNVCMDMCMFDVSGIGEIGEGEEVILFGRPEDRVTADDLALIMDTINYEVVTAVGARVPRVFKNGRS